MKKGRKKHRGTRSGMLLAEVAAIGEDSSGRAELEPRSLDSESSVLTVTPRDQLMEVTGRVT